MKSRRALKRPCSLTACRVDVTGSMIHESLMDNLDRQVAWNQNLHPHASSTIILNWGRNMSKLLTWTTCTHIHIHTLHANAPRHANKLYVWSGYRNTWRPKEENLFNSLAEMCVEENNFGCFWAGNCSAKCNFWLFPPWIGKPRCVCVCPSCTTRLLSFGGTQQLGAM